MREKIPAIFAFTGCRIYQDILKDRYNDILHLYRPEEKQVFTKHKSLLFYEYVGNNLSTLGTIEGIIKRYQNAKFFMIIDDCYEGLIDSEFIHQVKRLNDTYSNLEKFQILSSNYNVKEMCKEILGGDDAFTYFNIHPYMYEYDNVVISEHTHTSNDILREKKFLCVNRQERAHRIRTIDFLSREDILKHTYASCLIGDYAPLLYKGTQFKAQNPEIEKYQDPDLGKIILTQESKERLSKILPLELDVKDHQGKAFSTNMPSLEKYFDESYFSIITEGDFKSSTGKKQYTEKILKCFAYHHPFLVIGLPGTIELIQDEGFITFGSFIDESYDKEYNDDKRMNMVFQEIKKINELNMHELKNMYEDMLPILEHNYQHYINKHGTAKPGKLVNNILEWYYL